MLRVRADAGSLNGAGFQMMREEWFHRVNARKKNLRIMASFVYDW